MARKKIAFVDSTLRDGQETLLGGRLRVELVAPLLDTMDAVGFRAIEAWGGGTFLASLALLHEDPWERLRLMRKELNRTPIQMLLRGRFLVGDRPFSYGFVQKFLNRSYEHGISVVRLYDPLNNLASLSKVARIANGIGLTVEASVLCSDWSNLNYYRDLIRRTDTSSFDSLGLFDPLGTLSAARGAELIELIHDAYGGDSFVHLHDLDGAGISTLMKALEKGTSTIDACFSAFTCVGSLPSIEAVLRSLGGDGLSGELNLNSLLEASSSFWRLRREYFDLVPSIMQPATPMEKTMQEMKPTVSSWMGLKSAGRSRSRENGVRRETEAIVHDLSLVTLVSPLYQIIARQLVFNLRSKRRYARLTDEFLRLLRGEYGWVKVPRILSSLINNSSEMKEGRRDEFEEREVALPQGGRMSKDDLLSFELFPSEWAAMKQTRRKDFPWRREDIVAAALAILAQGEVVEEHREGPPKEVQMLPKSHRWRDAARSEETGLTRRRGFIEEPF